MNSEQFMALQKYFSILKNLINTIQGIHDKMQYSIFSKQHGTVTKDYNTEMH